ncbi:serine/threonine kinase family protein [Apiospora phragmitis]|uniref:Serine/threonine kinase family protein n=1 Tax=Apiospora phragmitis TaxID=2905665 RepID=A0ABR1UST0_9PEZI
MANRNTMKVLAVKEVSDLGGYIVRARFDGLIRYFSVTNDAAARFPAGWNKAGGSGPLIPPGHYPPDLKCIHLRRPDHRDNMDPKDVTDYPIAELLTHELTGLPTFDYDDLIQFQKISSPRFGHRLSEDRLRRVRGNSSLVMKLAEFPDTWPSQVTSSLRPAGAPSPPATVGLASADSEGDPGAVAEEAIAYEIVMHHAVATAAHGADARLLAGRVPDFYGVVTERGRGVVGFLAEYVEGSRSFFDLFRDAVRRGDADWSLSEADRAGCRDALKRLHRAGFLHGDVHAGNFLRCEDGSVVMIDFEYMVRLGPNTVLEGEHMDTRVEVDELLLEQWLNLKASIFVRSTFIRSDDAEN